MHYFRKTQTITFLKKPYFWILALLDDNTFHMITFSLFDLYTKKIVPRSQIEKKTICYKKDATMIRKKKEMESWSTDRDRSFYF